jgi:hypothetical protein
MIYTNGVRLRQMHGKSIASERMSRRTDLKLRAEQIEREGVRMSLLRRSRAISFDRVRALRSAVISRDTALPRNVVTKAKASENDERRFQEDPDKLKKPQYGGGTDSNNRMHVPTDAFGGMSPEFKAAQALKTLFTMVAVRVVMAQEEGYDNEGGGGTPTSISLGKFLDENPLRDGNQWLQLMLGSSETELRLIALRLIEVRRAYAENQFDFEGVKSAAREQIERDNNELMLS